MSLDTLAIKTQNLTKSFGSLLAVDNVSFSIKKQEILGFLGPNGAGKTTTIRIITGLFPLPPGSSVEILGKEMKKNPLLCKAEFGIVPETSNAFFDMTVAQNLHFTGKLYGLSNEQIAKRSELLLKQYDLVEKTHVKSKSLSKGQKQRLHFCMALLHDPSILILDEPTSGLDPISIRILRDQILQLRAAGKTILLTTHDMQEAQKICDRILIINKGKIIIDESPESLRTRFSNVKNFIFKPVLELEDQLKNGIEKRLPHAGPLSPLKNGFYQIKVDDPIQDTAMILAFFQQENIQIADFRVEDMPLEDIFFKLIKKETHIHE
jgi:ABC-2 type transport system ATP-binding protein